MLETIFTILRKTKYREVVIEIIQSLGMFLANIQKQTCLSKIRSFLLIIIIFFLNKKIVYILSNNILNEFISYRFNFLDEELVAFYITFLKSLSLRLSTVPIQLFFNEVKKKKKIWIFLKKTKIFSFSLKFKKIK